MRTARSRLCKSQKAQLPSHRFPNWKAVGRMVFFKISCMIGPSLLCSTTRAMATASWKSPSCLMQTLTASFNEPPSKKKAAAYSWRRSDVELFHNCRYFTKTLLAKQCIRILECSSSPSRDCEIVAKELQHNSVFLVPGSLPPQSLN